MSNRSRIDRQFGPLDRDFFGLAVRGSALHVKNAMVEYGIPVMKVERCRVDNCGDILLDDDLIGTYRYFDAIQQPLFRFKNNNYMQHRFVFNEKTSSWTPDFRLNLSDQCGICLIIQGEFATPEVRHFFESLLTSLSRDELSDSSHMKMQLNVESSPTHSVKLTFSQAQNLQQIVETINRQLIIRLHDERSRLKDEISSLFK